MVVAQAQGGVIGRNNGLPWRLPADLKHFKELTTGHSVIMGRKTYDSIVARLGGPLPDRTNVVVTRDAAWVAPGVLVAHSPQEALALAGPGEVFVIGGAQLYQTMLPQAERIYMTEVAAEVEGDAFFPQLATDQWREVRREEYAADVRNGYPYAFVVLERVRPRASKGYELRHARVTAQRQKMQELMAQGICAFCDQHFVKYHDEPIEFQTTYWTVTKNDYPYEGAKLHLLLVPRLHVRRFAELPVAAQTEFGKVLTRVEQQWQLPAYAVGMRAGDMELTGSTVEHLHAHVVMGDVDDPAHEPIRFKMSSRRT